MDQYGHHMPPSADILKAPPSPHPCVAPALRGKLYRHLFETTGRLWVGGAP